MALHEHPIIDLRILRQVVAKVRFVIVQFLAQLDRTLARGYASGRTLQAHVAVFVAHPVHGTLVPSFGSVQKSVEHQVMSAASIGQIVECGLQPNAMYTRR